MTSNGKSKRRRERLGLQLPVRIQCRETADHGWVEMTRLLDVTPFGASFHTAHPTEQGRLLHLTMPLPRQLRCFDHAEDQYRVWTLVRHVEQDETANGVLRFTVGSAFIGKHPPPSYTSDPAKRYEVAEPNEFGLCEVHEQKKRVYVRSDELRPETRLDLPIEVTIEVFDEKGGVATSEMTVTENISRRGAAVFTSLDVRAGCFVRLKSKQYKLSVTAAVRNIRTGRDGRTRLHLEFVAGEFPLEGI
ncbi:MAG: PilZ domain-containing protein [Pyrinomonadaceae bacterium]|nr:PilZ domain-containing protein [Pyrinomonadaceae bacterium]